MKDNLWRERALDPAQSFIVQAPAGSGKTELLTQRVLKLLTTVNMPEEILAVTFTRKAAAEMRQRILAALRRAKEEGEFLKDHERTTYELAKQVLARDEQFNWQLIKNPNRLKILTIDALCAYIVNRMPVLSQIGGTPNIVEFPESCYQKAVEQLLQQTTCEEKWLEALETLLLHLDNRVEIITTLLTSLLAKRDQWLPHLGKLWQTPEKLEHYLCEAIKLVVEQQLIKLNDKMAVEMTGLMPLITYARENCQQFQIDNPLLAFENITEPLLPHASALPFWQTIADFLITQKNEWRKAFNLKNGFPSANETKDKEEKLRRKENKEAISTLIEKLAASEGLLELLTEVKLLPAAELSNIQHTILNALAQLLPVLVAHLQLVFQELGQVDFVEVMLKALDALGEELLPSEIALNLDYQFRHILIDEYQDTSVTQYRLFEKLVMGWQPNDGRTLFLVGDPMQSIYRFRGAEVSLFIFTEQRGLGEVKLVPLKLTTNFRANSNLIQWLNQTFSYIFPTISDPSLGGVPYSMAVAPVTEDIIDKTHLHIASTEEEQIATVISVILQQRITAPQQSIAILVRAKRHLTKIIHALKQCQIDFVAHEAEHLALRGHVTDLLSMVEATQDWCHVIAWYAFLRAPWIGLSLADLLVIANHNEQGIVWEALQSFAHLPLSEDGKARLTRLVPILQCWFNARGRSSLGTWLRGLWLALGGPACYSSEGFINDIDKTFALIEQYTIGGKIKNWEELTAKMARLYGDILPQILNCETPKLELMTIHKAKGLEFDCVIIPYLHTKPVPNEAPLLLWYEHAHASGIELLLAARRAHNEEHDELYDYLNSRKKKKEALEAARLLYVGATRAKECLHFFAEMDEQSAPLKGSFLEMLAPYFSLEGSLPASQSLNALDNKSEPPVISRLSINWQLPPSIALKITANQEIATQSDLNRPELHDLLSRAMGIIFHRFLQAWLHETIHSFNLPVNAESTIKLALQRLGLSGKLVKEGVSIVMLGLKNMLTCQWGKWILDPSHSMRHTEWGLCYKTKSGVERKIIDYAFVDNTNTRWIIDYKLVNQLHMDEKLLAEELVKYSPQLKQYQQLVATLEQRKVRCGLYFPIAQQWREIV